jgi:hypothetical protein
MLALHSAGIPNIDELLADALSYTYSRDNSSGRQRVHTTCRHGHTVRPSPSVVFLEHDRLEDQTSAGWGGCPWRDEIVCPLRDHIAF